LLATEKAKGPFRRRHRLMTRHYSDNATPRLRFEAPSVVLRSMSETIALWEPGMGEDNAHDSRYLFEVFQ
jgi:hypothetical protein